MQPIHVLASEQLVFNLKAFLFRLRLVEFEQRFWSMISILDTLPNKIHKMFLTKLKNKIIQILPIQKGVSKVYQNAL